MGSLEAGFSHDIFVEWVSDTKNLILFSERGQVCSEPFASHCFYFCIVDVSDGIVLQ